MQSQRGQRGFTLLEAVVAVALLGILAPTVLGGLLFGIAQARGSLDRAAADAWAQEELDYLLIQGYSGLTVPTTRTLTQTAGYTNYGAISEPQIPAGFDHAVISLQAVAGASAKQLTVTLYRGPSTPPISTATFISNLASP